MMMLTSHETAGTPAPGEWRGRVVAGATVLGWILFAVTIASLFIGHSTSPYGVCYAASGRSIPCALAHR